MPEAADQSSHVAPTRLGVPRWLYAPDGRMGRVAFFYAIFARAFAISFVFSAISEFTVANSGSEPTRLIDFAQIPLFTIAFVLAAGGPVVRRLHDLNLAGVHSAWLCFSLVLARALLDRVHFRATPSETVLVLLASIPSILAFALMLMPGTNGPNRYGQSPN